MAIIPTITAVSHLNTIPFVYGLKHADNLRADLLLAPPAECAKNYIEGKADIALLPAAVVPELKQSAMARLGTRCGFIGKVGEDNTGEVRGFDVLKNFHHFFEKYFFS